MTAVVVLCAAVAAALLVPGRRPPVRQRLSPSTSPVETVRPPEKDLVVRFRALWACSAFAAGLVWGPEGLGLPAGTAAALTVWWAAGRSEPAAVRRRREEAARQLPHLVELYAAALASGAAPGPALAQVRAALPGPAGEELAAVAAGLDLGRPPAEVWAELGGHPALAPLGRTMARAQVSGAPVVDAVRVLADDLAATTRLDAEDRARAVGVRAALPLGLCLLPAFLLLGIVPLVVGAAAGVRW